MKHFARLALAAAALVAAVSHAQDVGDESLLRHALDHSIGDQIVMPNNGPLTYAPLLDYNPNLVGDGPALISSALTLTSTPMTLIVDCDARTVSGTSWPCATGGTLSEASAGTSPSLQRAYFTESGAREVEYINGKVHQAGNSTMGDFDNVDAVFEFIVKQTTTPGGGVAMVNKGGFGSAGWTIQDIGTVIQLRVDDNAGHSLGAYANCAGTGGGWCHAMCFFNRNWNNAASGTCYYGNGQQGSSSMNATTLTTSITNASALTVGSRSVFNQKMPDGGVALFRMWTCADCLPDSNTENAAVEAARDQALNGYIATLATGSATPIGATRTTTAFVDVDRDCDGTRMEFLITGNQPRIARRKDGSGNCSNGFLGEPPSTNNLLQSRTFQTTWTMRQTTVAGHTDEAAGPDGTLTMDGLLSDGTNNTHGVEQNTAATLINASQMFSVFVRAPNAIPSVMLYADDTPSAGTNVAARCFNLAGAGADLGIYTTTNNVSNSGVVEKWGPGLYRVQMTWTPPTTARTWAMKIYGINSSSVCSSASAIYTSAAVDLQLSGAQEEPRATQAGAVATSEIVTTTGTITRLNDFLTFSPTSNFNESNNTLAVSVLLPSHGTASADVGNPCYFMVNNGSSLNATWVSGVNDQSWGTYSVGGANQAQILTSVHTNYDNTIHSYRWMAALNSFSLYRDGTQMSTTDTSGSLWSGATVMQLSSCAGGLPGNIGITLRARSFAGAALPTGSDP